MANYFNSLNLREQLAQLGCCEFMERSEFANGCDFLKGKKVVIVGCGAQGLNQGLNLRDSGLDVSYALRAQAIEQKRASFVRASENGFKVGTYEELIPTADLVINLTPDKQHSDVVSAVMPLMKKGAALGYSHGFNIVEVGEKIRDDITVVMMAPKGPGTELRKEYERGFGIPTLIAVHAENDPDGNGMEIAKAWAAGTGGHRAGVLRSSFVAEVKSDLMGEQTILCGVLQAASILCYDHMVAKGVDSAYACKFIQYGWEVISEALKHGGITNMMNRLSNPAKLKACEIADSLKQQLTPLYLKTMDNIISGAFSAAMIEDWGKDDHDLHTWRENFAKSGFETASESSVAISEQEYFDKGILLVAFAKAGIELAFETMTKSGIYPESAYYESLHELPLIANLIARRRLYEMNVVISDTAEYGNYLFANAAIPLLRDYVNSFGLDVIGEGLSGDNCVDNTALIEANESIYHHPIEVVGRTLRAYMSDMKKLSFQG